MEIESHIINEQLVKNWLVARTPDSHKGDFGRALLVAGSKGMMGAALLAARSCMRSGVGLLTVSVPVCGYDILQLGIPEAKCDCDNCDTKHTQIVIPQDTEVLAIGPGIGQAAETHQALHELLLHCKLPMVIDADALNILAQHRDWLTLLPRNTILTPHPGEMKRLGFSPEALVLQYGLIVVLKGHITRIYYSDEGQIRCYENHLHGNAGMAVGGSGDVLTGIILALLAQHYQPVIAASLGVWIHALAGDLALSDHNSWESLLPSDIISHLGDAFRQSRQ